jgi:hypothetical protein
MLVFVSLPQLIQFEIIETGENVKGLEIGKKGKMGLAFVTIHG